MQQTNGVKTVMSQEQSDLVTSATVNGGQKNQIKNSKNIIITNLNNNNNSSTIINNNNNKNKITTILNNSNNDKSNNNNNNNSNNNNNNNSDNISNNNSNNSTNNSNNTNKNGRTSDSVNNIIVNSLQHKINTSTTVQVATTTNGKAIAAPLPDARAKQVLKEAVDAVVNSFTKHTQGYGRGEFIITLLTLYIKKFNSISQMTSDISCIICATTNIKLL